MHTLTVGQNDADKRIDRFLVKVFPTMPLSFVYKSLRTKKIKLNGKRAEPSDRLQAGDVLTLYIKDEFFEGKDARKAEKAQKWDDPALTLSEREIVYEDENVILIDKPQGELVHGDMPDEERKGTGEVCLVDRLCGYLYKTGAYQPQTQNSFAPALCNRLDRNTCGLVIAAKNAASLAVLNQKIKDRELEKHYRCVVWGVPEKRSATLHDYLYKDRAENRVYIAHTREELKRSKHVRYDDDIKTVVTRYEVVGEMGDKSLLDVELVTGRTHQIRAHLSSIGHPIVGDGKYGINHRSRTGKQYQMLCSYYLRFRFTTDAGALAYLDGKEFFSRYRLEELK